MRSGWFWLLVGLTGCDRVLGLRDFPDASLGTCLGDDFETGVLDPTRWKPYRIATPPNAVVSVASGALVVSMYPGAVDFNGIDDLPILTLTHGTVQSRLVEVPDDPLTELQQYIKVGTDSYIAELVSNELRLNVDVGGNRQMASIPYVPARDVYIRLRDGEDGLIHLDTAATPDQLTERANLPAVLSLANAHVGFNGGSFSTGAKLPVTAKFDDVLVMAPGCR